MIGGKKMVTIETTVTRIIGPYQGRRISGTSNDVVEAIVATTYNFDGFSIRIVDIPTCIDQATGASYLSGPIALRLNNKVNEIVAEVQHKQRITSEVVQRDTPLRFELTATDFLSDAA
ncbi:MAG: hypothetical protein M3176_01035 [Chloroflexota bacterium]|nr:hypothetical protein [Chloroflexota bacterium]